MNEANDLDTELGNALDAAISAEDAAATNNTQPAETTTESTETKTESTATGRDEKGRFKAKTVDSIQENETQGEQKEEQAGQEDERVETQPTESPTEAAIKPPSTYTIEGKTEFMKASPALQKEILKREQDMMRGIEEYRQSAAYAEKIQQSLSPYMATIQSLGVTPEVAIQQLLSADHNLRYGSPQQKAAWLGHIAQQYGIDISQLSTESSPIDPTVQALQNKLYQIEQHLTQQNTQAQTAEQQYVMGEIGKFESDPAHLYFNDVRAEMAALLTSGRAENLKDAYDKACWANPQIREILLKQQNENAERKRLADLAQKAQTAKRAGFDVQGTGTAAATSNKALSLEEELGAQLQ